VDEDLLTAREVAPLLRIRPVTVYAAAKAGRLPHVVLWRGSRRALIRFRRSEIEAFLAARRVDADESR
jgi:excisionase family DNA binding protein